MVWSSLLVDRPNFERAFLVDASEGRPKVNGEVELGDFTCCTINGVQDGVEVDPVFFCWTLSLMFANVVIVLVEEDPWLTTRGAHWEVTQLVLGSLGLVGKLTVIWLDDAVIGVKETCCLLNGVFMFLSAGSASLL